MREINLMPMNICMNFFFQYQQDHDIEKMRRSFEGMLDLVQAAGYRGVDVTCWDVALFGVDYVKAALKKRNFRAGSYLYSEKFASMDENGFQARVDGAKHGADMAAELGTEVLMLVVEGQKEITQYKPAQIHKRLIDHWTPVTAYAKGLGLHVAVEDTPVLPLHFCRADDVVEVLDAVEGLELLYDSANMTLVGEDPVEFLKKFTGRIAYVHLKDYRKAPAGSRVAEYAQDGTAMLAAPTGTGAINLEKVTQALEEIGYQGDATVEFQADDNKDYLQSLIRSKKYIERLLTRRDGNV